MATSAPWIMPDGRSLKEVLRAEGAAPARGKGKDARKKQRSKDDMWHQLQRHKATASEHELAELRAIERAGMRRRQRWLNDKLLRDLAGPMSVEAMEGCFNPAPFGSYPPPSAFALAAAPESAALWEHFRTIDLDREAKVLQRWEAHHREQQAAQRSTGEPRLLTRHQQQESAAAAALSKWASVGRSARAALKRAAVHSLLELEVQVLQLLDPAPEQDDPDAELVLDLPDGFARLLAHGLAQFHGLRSATRVVDGGKRVVLQRSRQPRASAEQQQQRPPAAEQPTAPPDACGSAAASAAAVPLAAASGGSDPGCGREGPAHAHGAEWLLCQSGITCCDVVMALRELGGLDRHSLRSFLRHMHGTPSEVLSEDYVLV